MSARHLIPMFATLGCLAAAAQAQVSLTGTVHLESFDQVGSGLPPGWSVRLGATTASAGALAGFDGAAYAWSGSGGGFHNYASADALPSDAGASLQAAAGDRALGVRQTSSVGDPGAALVFQVADTLDYRDFTLSFSFQLVDEEGREGTWTLDYALGYSPASFTSLGTCTRDSWGSQTESFALPSEINDQPQPLWIRLAALTPSTGSGSRDSIALDDFQLSYRPVAEVPEPEGWALGASVGLLGLAAWKRARRGN